MLKIARCHSLFFDQGAEDGQLDYVAEMKLSLPGFEIQLHFNLLHLEVAKELALGRRLADKVVGRVQEADHRLFISDRDV